MRRLFLAALGFAALLGFPLAAQEKPVTVFAAASLTTALEEVGKAYAAKGNATPKFSFAASSALARQIEQGAEAALFVSADEPWMDYLAERKLIVPGSRKSILANRLVLIAPADRPQTVSLGPGSDLGKLIGEDKLVTGDPAHVPVGRYAEAALRKLGLWAGVERKLARTENVRAALTLVERGEAPFGIVYATDAAVSRKVMVAGTFPADSHPPITYPFAIIQKQDGPAARALFAYLVGPEAAAVYRKSGFATE
jgi:molybdate transport system substrate-binding protein